MRTRVIPAQITTVEDKIAGSLNLPQILLLMLPVFWSTVVYAVLPPTMHLAWYKLPLVLCVALLSLTLALRVKGKLIAQWLVILLRYTLRPKYYVFNKNEVYLRDLHLPVFEKKPFNLFKKAKATKKATVPDLTFENTELIRLEQVLATNQLSWRLKADKKGGFHVAFEQVS